MNITRLALNAFGGACRRGGAIDQLSTGNVELVGRRDQSICVVELAYVDAELRCTDLSEGVVQTLAARAVGSDGQKTCAADAGATRLDVAALSRQAHVACRACCAALPEVQACGIKADVACCQNLPGALQICGCSCGQDTSSGKLAIRGHARSQYMGGCAIETACFHSQVLGCANRSCAAHAAINGQCLAACRIHDSAVVQGRGMCLKCLRRMDAAAVAQGLGLCTQGAIAHNARTIRDRRLIAALGVVEELALATQVEASATGMQQLACGVIDVPGSNFQVTGCGLNHASPVVQTPLQGDCLVAAAALDDLSTDIAQSVGLNTEGGCLYSRTICRECPARLQIHFLGCQQLTAFGLQVTCRGLQLQGFSLLTRRRQVKACTSHLNIAGGQRLA
ncbi:hypothetical protein APV28_4769 [Comamonas testosteroni]|nr:hypothetical protein APV28_4769 [Comamonas testosteroni]